MYFVEQVYGQDKSKEKITNQQRTAQYATVLLEAMEQGLGKIDYDTPDWEMRTYLRDNIWQFSSAKTIKERQELTELLTDDEGNVRSFADFKAAAAEVVEKFQVTHLKTEYDTAINSSYLAARWHEFDDDAILVFRTAGDNRVRHSHRLLDGVSLPKSHPFWNKFYPPLSWNCRCTVETTHSGRVTKDENIPWGEIDDIPANFRANLAKDKQVFPNEQ